MWYLMQPDSTRGALLRIGMPLKTIHYEGAEGAERRVRTVWGNGTVTFYEGEKGMERFVRGEHPRGDVFYLEGEKGVEHKVRWEQPCGDVSHYEGEMNAERLVRYELYEGDGAWLVFYYEGEKGTERVVRTIWHFDPLPRGEQGTAQPKVVAQELFVAALLAAISEVILYLCWQILAHLCWLVLLYATGLRSV